MYWYAGGRAQYKNVLGSIHQEGVFTMFANFFELPLKLTNEKRLKVTCLMRY